MTLPQTNLNEVDIEGKAFQIHTVSNIDQLFDDLLTKGPEDESVKDERIPYWAELWPSAIALSNYLIRQSVIQPGMKVLELGCGVGLPGIVAGSLGAEVIFSDYIQDTLTLASLNWTLNNHQDAQFLLMDWRKPLQEIKAELLLASDIAYERKSFDDLIKAFKVLIKPDGKILVSEPNRAYSQSFFHELTDHGFLVKSETEELEFRFQKYRVHIFDIRLKG